MSSTVLTWDKPLTIEIVRELADEVLGALRQTEELVVDLQGCPEIDLACMQLLCAAERSASREGKRFVLRLSEDSPVVAVAEAGGFIRHSPCLHDCKDCVWMVTTFKPGESA
ncbi:MAG: hypothetical protein C0621_08925 [Desulfuromonas sp.]|nr:MAG: hypothetical protein C0621_08925 [Desulfuromonas sp.]